MNTKLKNNMGLTTDEAKKLQIEYGKNELTPKKKENFFFKILKVISEPMFLLLISTAVIYFILGEPTDAFIMLIFVVGIIGIEVLQEWRTDKTLNSLKNLSAPHVKVIRDGVEREILSSEIVPNDVMIIHEGVKIPADGKIIRQNDLCVDESSLTGESEGVWKTINKNNENEISNSENYWRKDYCYAGTIVIQGMAHILVDKIGQETEYGKIGAAVINAEESPTPLQKQTGKLIKTCVIIAGALFLTVCIVTWSNLSDLDFGERLTASILAGITLAMAMIPEEFPVILTVFLSMGAWRLAKKKSLVHKLPSVETLGAISVLCVDKTGTITKNQMEVQEFYSVISDEDIFCETMGLACETDAYDPMEKAMIRYCEENGITKSHLFGGDLIDEYAFTNELKMMGHIWFHDDEIIIAAKGSPESILPLCSFDDSEYKKIENRINEMSEKGLRVIAVAFSKPKNKSEIPPKLTDCKLELNGLVGLSDPPRESVEKDIEICNNAGIRVVMITGDNGITAVSIAKKIGIKNCDVIITGDMIEKMSDEELREKIKTVNIFSRVIPEHKMRVVKAFKDNGEIVAMTGDGVNDAPALKYADIGIAMGGRGSEVARDASDIILMDDNFSTIVETVRDGRRIFDNIKKAVGYVFAIHIPIAMASLFAPILGIPTDDLFLLPIHVVLLELIIDPTCSIVLERQPEESDIMNRNPRDTNKNLLDSELLIKSIMQGALIFMTSFGLYYSMLTASDDAKIARSMGLAVIMFANLFLVHVNSSENDSVLLSIKNLAKDKVMLIVNISAVMLILIMLYSPISNFLKLAPLTLSQLATALLFAAVSVLWYELVKFMNRISNKKTKTI